MTLRSRFARVVAVCGSLAFMVSGLTVFPFGESASATEDPLPPASSTLAPIPSNPNSTPHQAPTFNHANSKKTKDGTVSIHILDLGSPVLNNGSDLHVTAVVTNTSGSDADVTDLQLEAQTRSVNRAINLYEWFSGESFTTKVIGTSSNLNVPAGSERRLNFTVPATQLPWKTSEQWNAHGIEVNGSLVVNTKETTISDRSVVLTSNGSYPSPMPVSVVVPVTQSTDTLAKERSFYDDVTGGVPTPETDAEASVDEASADGASTIAQTIQKFDLRGVHLLLDPTALNSANARSALATNQNTSAELLPRFDTDYAALAHLQQLDYARQIVRESNGASQNIVTQPKLGYAFLQGKVDQTTINFLQQAGVRGAIVPSSSLAQRTDSYYTPAPHTTLPTQDSQLDVLITDSIINNAISGSFSPTSDDPALKLDSLNSRQVSLALTAIHTFQAPNYSRPILISVPRNSVGSGQTLSNVQAILQAPWLSPVPFASLAQSESNRVRYRPLSQNTVNGGEFDHKDFTQLTTYRSQLESFANIFQDRSPFMEIINNHSNRLFAVNFRSNVEKRKQYLESLSDDSGLFKEIHFEPLSTINMISETASIPVRLTNPLPFPIQVTVQLKGSDSRLYAPQPVKVAVPAHNTVNVSVPVQARGSGNLRFLLSISNDAGQLVGKSMSVNVRVRASWESTGTLILAALVAGVLVFGLVKSVHNGRRSKPVAPEEFTSKLKAAEEAEEEDLKKVPDMPHLD
ncbi:DUF6049 family protein [Arcanobacterium ihumii]|uniref:DUF6049 family protein n=1 Tax=Arcanobacterium ihumii TaxID=2138162 RepID=UPI000F5494C8|nr:DUF6049 family protein [Arcanobacterium ihumii]